MQWLKYFLQVVMTWSCRLEWAERKHERTKSTANVLARERFRSHCECSSWHDCTSSIRRSRREDASKCASRRTPTSRATMVNPSVVQVACGEIAR
ncbi:hypothetical protein IF1G_04438 [Cordyceps javanica]|uniref:Uncharacterized protein n=1 Tax=Cordyceps javanica TaxID=43265 RepID=A0A545V680_9HYPO|nr:hypothetical protein IF1G_04438 [Cordyceps javanica]